MVDVQRTVADVAGLPPLAWRVTVGMRADVSDDRQKMRLRAIIRFPLFQAQHMRHLL